MRQPTRKHSYYLDKDRSATNYYSSVRHHRLLTAAEEYAYAKKMHDGDIKAKNILIECNLRLVVKIATEFNAKGSMTMLDLISEGNIGLIHGIEKFKPELGYRLSTYATWWIRQHISRSIMNRYRLIRIPVHHIKIYHQLCAEHIDICNEFNRDPTPYELAERLGVTEDYVIRLQGLFQNIVSINESYESGIEKDIDEDEYHDTDHLTNCISSLDAKKQIAKYLSFLNERQQRILMMIYGLNNYDTHSLQQCSIEFGVGRERIRQIHLDALAKIQKRILEETDNIAA
ncbi:sigma-70 family RNA polymerase sigma factor [Francisellaceae bacterium]|nr:sigma-70 family RNA polymerase sigma factor [Francisellaceae bacterium]